MTTTENYLIYKSDLIKYAGSEDILWELQAHRSYKDEKIVFPEKMWLVIQEKPNGYDSISYFKYDSAKPFMVMDSDDQCYTIVCTLIRSLGTEI